MHDHQSGGLIDLDSGDAQMRMPPHQFARDPPDLRGEEPVSRRVVLLVAVLVVVGLVALAVVVIVGHVDGVAESIAGVEAVARNERGFGVEFVVVDEIVVIIEVVTGVTGFCIAHHAFPSHDAGRPLNRTALLIVTPLAGLRNAPFGSAALHTGAYSAHTLHRRPRCRVSHSLKRMPRPGPAPSYRSGMDIRKPRPARRAAADSASTCVTAYLKKIGRVPLLTAAEEVEVARRIEVGLLAADRLTRLGTTGSDSSNGTTESSESSETASLREELRWLAGDGARAVEHLICANLRLVVSVARHYVGGGLEFPDLIQEGNVGLIRAVERFDFARGFKFSTYASWWIRQSISRAQADQSRTIRLPVQTADSLLLIAREEHAIRQRLRRDGTNQELSRATGLTRNRVVALREHARAPRSLDAPVWVDFGNGPEPMPFGDTVSDAQAMDPADIVGRTLLLEGLESRVSALPGREERVLRMRFGLGCERPRTLREVGALLGVTPDRVRQIEVRAIARLRHPSNASPLDGGGSAGCWTECLTVEDLRA
ncbi:sigma-70 family RNA polymerase sigma factor [Cryobacterium sp. TmT2-59]|nr:sigma-70 family RNA polymerase sigma factor [Cryobacterium sp. TmT2-59]